MQSCPFGYNSTNMGCVDINECSNITICGEIHCRNTPGGYECLPCEAGFQAKGGECVDVNECLIENGGRDWRVTCTNTKGSRSCGPCPEGSVGDGDIQCKLQCGDGHCNDTLLETCVTCPRDCQESTCGKCGDGVCEGEEDCNNCYEDCKSKCLPPTSSCECSEHGTCINGVCVCSGSWTGPTCLSTYLC